MRTVEATLQPDGRVQTAEPLGLTVAVRVLVTVHVEDGSLLADEAVLADCSRREEDEAWTFLQPAQSR